MKLTYLKKYLPVIEAAANGKTIQIKGLHYVEWTDIDDTFGCLFDQNDESTGFTYRIKPEPKLRAWKPEEVPVGALYKWVNHVSVILAANGKRLYFLDELGIISWNEFEFGCLSNNSKHSTDGGKTWLPCGVLE